MKQEENISKLSDIPKKDVFNPPKGYMDSLDEQILEKIDHQEKKGGRKIYTWYGAVAAAVTLLISVGILLHDRESASPKELLADVSDTDIAAYLEYSEVSVFEIMDELNSEELDIEEESVLPELDLSEEELQMIMDKYDISG